MKNSHYITILSYFKTNSQAEQAEKKYENKLRNNLTTHNEDVFYADSVHVIKNVLKIEIGFDIVDRISDKKKEIMFKEVLHEIKEWSVEIQNFILSVNGLVSIRIENRLSAEDVVLLCGENIKLKNSLLKIQSNKNEYNRICGVYEYFGNWDAEDNNNFDEPTLGIKINVEKWSLHPLLKVVSRLFETYSWKSIQLSDERYVFVTKHKQVYVVNGELEDGGVERTAWNIGKDELSENAKNALWGQPADLKDIDAKFIMNIDDLEVAEKQSVGTEEYEKAVSFRDEIKKRKITT